MHGSFGQRQNARTHTAPAESAAQVNVSCDKQNLRAATALQRRWPLRGCLSAAAASA